MLPPSGLRIFVDCRRGLATACFTGLATQCFSQHLRGRLTPRAVKPPCGAGPPSLTHPHEPVKGGGRAMLSKIVIEAEAHGDSETRLRLSIDNQLIAENLTAAQARLLIEEILDRIPFAQVWGDARDEADASASRGGSLLGPRPRARPSPRSHAACAKRISVLKPVPKCPRRRELKA